jgi:RimJ/RimL family protein N-acetyltransferase
MSSNLLHLRSPTWQEMPLIRQLWNDPDTMAPVGGPILLTDEQAEQWFKRMIQPGSPTDYYCLIFVECDRAMPIHQAYRPVGEISYHNLDTNTMTADFNLKIARSERGKGYAPAAMQLFFDNFFNQRGGKILVDDVALENHRGQQVLLKFGFTHDASRSNVFRLTLTREQFNHLYPQG